MTFKTYAVANDHTHSVSIVTLDDENPCIETFGTFKILAETDSTLAVRYKLDGGDIVDAYPGKTDQEVLDSLYVPTIVVDVLDIVKKTKITQVRTHFNNIVDSIKNDVASYEVATWDVQRMEYVEWLKDPATPTPYVTTLATARGMDLGVLMTRIGARVTALAQVQGLQQAMEDQVLACTTVEQVLAIEMPVLG